MADAHAASCARMARRNAHSCCHCGGPAEAGPRTGACRPLLRAVRREPAASSDSASSTSTKSPKAARATPRRGWPRRPRRSLRISRKNRSWWRWTSAARIIDSAVFARHLGRWRDEGAGHTIFVIGGADGLSPELRRKAKLAIAFGAATWPHQMVRVMLLEQLYRAATILAGHPYHRA